MELFILIAELIGTVSFAISGAVTGLRKNMDVFGVIILGLTTAIGGGIIRDVLLGDCPPRVFQTPYIALTAIGTSIVVFLPAIRRALLSHKRLFDLLLFATDTVGLGIFTVNAVRIALEHSDNLWLVVFIATVTGVGGGVTRDIFAGNIPYIFIKHIYACAALLGAVICVALWRLSGANIAMLVGAAATMLLRCLAARFNWNMPRAGDVLL